MMRPEQALVIYEIRAADEAAFGRFERPGLFGPHFAGLHREADFAFVFFTGDPGGSMVEFVRGPGLDLRQIHHLRYDQWQDGAGAEPFTVGGLTVTPPEHRNAPEDLVIDPGLAFGFGGHPTTYYCLEFLARACRTNPPARALDLGCGTGVLSLAAARLGVRDVLGVDYSHLAASTARWLWTRPGRTWPQTAWRAASNSSGERPRISWPIRRSF